MSASSSATSSGGSGGSGSVITTKDSATKDMEIEAVIGKVTGDTKISTLKSIKPIVKSEGHDVYWLYKQLTTIEGRAFIVLDGPPKSHFCLTIFSMCDGKMYRRLRVLDDVHLDKVLCRKGKYPKKARIVATTTGMYEQVLNKLGQLQDRGWTIIWLQWSQ